MFGQVWEWFAPPPMMAICQVADHPYATGYSRQWRFVTLDAQSEVIDMWVGSQNNERPVTWYVLEDE